MSSFGKRPGRNGIPRPEPDDDEEKSSPLETPEPLDALEEKIRAQAAAAAATVPPFLPPPPSYDHARDRHMDYKVESLYGEKAKLVSENAALVATLEAIEEVVNGKEPSQACELVRRLVSRRLLAVAREHAIL